MDESLAAYVADLKRQPVEPGNGRCSRCGAEEEQDVLDQLDGECTFCEAQQS